MTQRSLDLDMSLRGQPTDWNVETNKRDRPQRVQVRDTRFPKPLAPA